MSPTTEEQISVLLVDDQSIIGEAISRMLAPEKDIVFNYCHDPTLALKVANECKPTIILQDLVMPQMDGLLLVQYLRSKDSPTCHIPLIVLSSKEEPVIKAKAFSLGANDYLVKLPDKMELIARIRYHSTAYINFLKRQEAEALFKAEILRQAAYIEEVNRVTAAASDVERDAFEPDALDEVAKRSDELGKLARVFTNMVKTVKVREKELITANTQLESLLKAYGRFVPHEYLRFLRKDAITDVNLGDHVSKVMAVMFSDIRSFTTISENMTPQDNFNFVNAYLKRVSPEIRSNYGIIVKFLGDGMMAVFPEGADDAIAAGVAKQNQVQEYNKQRAKTGYLPLEVGIGIHVGHMMLGMVGEESRMQGDAFSDNVNLTARLEGLTKFYGVSLLISEQALQNMSTANKYQIRFLDRVIVKGRTEAIAVYEVLDAEVEEVRQLKIKTQPDFEAALQYYKCADFTTARESFEKMLSVNPTDKTAKLYLERIEILLQRRVPENWNGVWALTEK
ncbi:MULTISPECIES: response regulator [unclassified Tolypothrix]|uniref:response regulator n=1 Tax=unclassified Tolypothrix TaxID=2649714 RepID=UPI0005EAB798|nr:MULTISPECIES: adenylate/guanylate cyclase domain-containing protein [unclassified Tolypothrix]BAY91198.1 adenylate cyclase, family 3 protein [Microchaete diplosiphon NIES-3275]EKF00024.1 adenylate and Guanylate cyclase catalytic domain protein [Tolypothrix sp. PCC 7601]MBE9080843.1 response regulator [Tolypothrix sp. LEGE 11397]UYD25281.1 response regulator [Tolypothrix sp. PCC 7712]UYD32479.1 response regulator [Tolypothrix sp. PCC 7601]